MLIKFLREGAECPIRALPGDVGFDLKALSVETLDSGVVRVYTGVAVSPDDRMYFELVPRSSIYKKGWILANSVGIIDQGYTGEVIAHFYPAVGVTQKPIEVGDKVVQLIPRQMIDCKFEVVEDLEKTSRSDRGFGSTGN